MADNSKWYVVHTYSGYENKVATNIEKVAENRGMQDEILEVRVPMVITENTEDDELEIEEVASDENSSEKSESKRRKKKDKTNKQKLFPGYVFVKVAVVYDKDNQPSMSDEAWYVIRNTRGCTGFVGPESKPVPLTEEEVFALGVEKKIIEVSYKVDDLVEIVDGIFEGFSGVVQEIDTNKGVVKVLVSALFGKETVVELELNQVEPAIE